MEVAIRMMSDSFHLCASNAAYMAGILVTAAGPDSVTYFPAILAQLTPLLSNPKHKKCCDNACGLLGKMLIVAPHALPVDQALIALLSNLPLKEDYSENPAAYEPLFRLISAKHPVIESGDFIERIVLLFSNELSTPEERMQVELKEQMAASLRWLVQWLPARMQSLLNALPAAQQHAVQACLTAH